MAILEAPPPSSTDARTSVLPHLILRVGDQHLAISSVYARQLLQTPQVFALPSRPPAFRGVIKVRGEVIALIDLRVLLGLPPVKRETQAEGRVARRDASREVVVILSDGKRPFAVTTDEVLAIETLDPNTIEPLSDVVHCSAKLTPFVARRAGGQQVIAILDFNAFSEALANHDLPLPDKEHGAS